MILQNIILIIAVLVAIYIIVKTEKYIKKQLEDDEKFHDLVYTC